MCLQLGGDLSELREAYGAMEHRADEEKKWALKADQVREATSTSPIRTAYNGIHSLSACITWHLVTRHYGPQLTQQQKRLPNSQPKQQPRVSIATRRQDSALLNQTIPNQTGGR